MGKRRHSPSLKSFFETEEAILASRLKGLRTAITHPAEKGRSVENEVIKILRDFLPSEYGLGTGFVLYHDPMCVRNNKYYPSRHKPLLSDQIDIIIYDGLRSGPLIRLGACDVYPIESVFGYVEVKTFLENSNFTDLVSQSDRLRSIRLRFFHSTVVGNPTAAPLLLQESISIRSFIFVLDGQRLGTAQSISKKIETALKRTQGPDSFITGMFINGKGFFRSPPLNRPNDPGKYTIAFDEQNALGKFKSSLYSDLSRYPRFPREWTPALDLYIGGIAASAEPTQSFELKPLERTEE